MANNPSSKKRVRSSEKCRQVNRNYSAAIRTLTKKYKNSVELYKLNPSNENLVIIQINLNNTFSKIDKAQKKNIIHPNNASNKKSKLSRLYNKECV
jgi:small subunit ribosomal protein S20